MPVTEYKEKLVAFLRQKGYEVKDFGTHSAESMDYPDTAHPMAVAVESGRVRERNRALWEWEWDLYDCQ